MANALVHTLLQALEVLEDRQDQRTADRVIQRMRLLPEEYQHIGVRFEKAVQGGYPDVLTDTLIDEIEHAVHETRSKKNLQANYIHGAKDARAHPKPLNNATAYKEKEVSNYRKNTTATYQRPGQEVSFPHFNPKSRHPHQKAMLRAQKKQQVERRIDAFNTEITQQSFAWRVSDHKQCALKPEMDLSMWLRPEYVPTQRYSSPDEWRDEWEDAIAQANYLELSNPEQTCSNPALSSDILQIMKEEGSVYFFIKQQWGRIMAQPAKFVFEKPALHKTK